MDAYFTLPSGLRVPNRLAVACDHLHRLICCPQTASPEAESAQLDLGSCVPRVREVRAAFIEALRTPGAARSGRYAPLSEPYVSAQLRTQLCLELDWIDWAQGRSDRSVRAALRDAPAGPAFGFWGAPPR